MPYQWNAERERRMLLLAISSADLRPSADTWQRVAGLLGDGLTASAVSQKYYKLRKESAKFFDSKPGSSSQPATPKKRKAEATDEYSSAQTPSPAKRPREQIRLQREAIDGEPFSDSADSSTDVKAEDMAANILDSFQSYNAASFTPAAFYGGFDMNGHLSTYIPPESGGNTSFMS